MPIRLYDYTPVLPVNVSRPDKAAGRTRKIWRLGTRLKSPMASPSIFAYCNQPNTGSGEGLGVGYVVKHTNCLQSLDLPGGLEKVPSEGKEYCHYKNSRNEHPVVRDSCSHHDGQKPKEKLQCKVINKK